MKKIWGERRHHGVSAAGPLCTSIRRYWRSIRMATSSWTASRTWCNYDLGRLIGNADRGDDAMKATETAACAGPEPVAGQHHPRSADQRHAAALYRRTVGHRADLEPDDLRPCRRAQHILRRGDQAPGRGRQVGRGAVLRTGDPGSCARPPTCSRRSISGPPAVDGWVSLEVSPLLAHDTARTVAEARALHAKANRPNLFIKIPGTLEGLPAIEEAIFAGVPVNVTLLFSRDDYLRAADAYMRGLERRVAAGLEPGCAFGRLGVRQPLGQGDDGQGSRRTSRPAWHRGLAAELQGVSRPVGVATAGNGWKARARGRSGCCSPAPSNKDPQASDVLYMGALAAPNTVNTVPEETLLAFANHGQVDRAMPRGRRRCRAGAGRDSRGPASMSARWPGNCRTRARRASSIPGRICSAPSRRRARR